MRKRLVVLSDLHSGHRSGLTPPDWQWKNTDGDRGKFAKVQKTIWDFYIKLMDELQPIYALVVNGDAIDGKGPRSGGTEQVTLDRNEQVEMAKASIEIAKPKKLYFVRGTKYHTGESEDWEDALAERFRTPIKDHLWIDVDGILFDIKHKAGVSQIPHGRYTSIARAALWEQLWADAEERKPADVIIRSHVHYHVHCGDSRFLAMTTPGLQGYSKYGVRECEGIVHIGAVWFDIDGGYSWDRRILSAKSLKSEPIKL